MKGIGFLMSIMVLWATAAESKIVTARVPYRDGNVALQGYLAYDDKIEGKRPGILVVHEWWGLNEYAQKRAEQLAELGYVAFALDMYGKEKVTTHPEQASEWAKQVSSNMGHWQQRAVAGLKVLQADPRVDPNRIAAIGYCFGGSTVQQLAYGGADIKGVVSFHGSLLTPTEQQARRTKASILICHGAADPLVEKGAIEEYLADMDKTGLDWQMVIFAGAKHSFTNPEADKAGMSAVGYNKLADQRSWQYMKDFFAEIFALQ